MSIDKSIRKMARSQYWQDIFTNCKRVPSLNLFLNTNNISGLQQLFLYWVKTYSILYDELGNKDWDNLTEEVIKDDVRCDAFLYWRRKKIEAKIYENKIEENKNDKKSRGKNPGKNFAIYQGNKK